MTNVANKVQARIFTPVKKIGLLSDTHGYLDPKIYTHFADVDELWHAGDIGSIEVLDALNQFKPTRAVYGNIDDAVLRRECNEFLFFEVEQRKILITHIGGRPGKYNQSLYAKIQVLRPDIVVCGHSHILLVAMDKRINALWLNPGACGIKGFHQVKTLLTFELDAGRIQNMQAIEIGKRV